MARINTPQLVIDAPSSTTLVTTAETIVATINGLTSSGAATQYFIEGQAQITSGTGTTGVQLRVRRGTTLAGAQVGTTQQTAGDARTQASFSINVDDSPGEVANQSYVLTAQQVAATGNGTCTAANLAVTAIG